MQAVTIEEIRRAAERLANAHNDVAACAAHLNAEIKAAIGPIRERYRETLDAAAARESSAQEALENLLLVAPHLFAKPRSLTVDGVRCGYIKAADSLDWADEAEVIARIKALRPDLAAILIRTQESLVVDALSGVDSKDLASFGIRTITGADRRFVTVGDNDVEKLAKVIVADAMRRQGEDEAPKAAKGKAKLKVAA